VLGPLFVQGPTGSAVEDDGHGAGGLKKQAENFSGETEEQDGGGWR
jgi:hypothetical protein